MSQATQSPASSGIAGEAMTETGSAAGFKLLVVGNGPTAVDADGVAHVERQLGELLLELREGDFDVSFLQASVPLEPSMTYFGMTLPEGQVTVIPFRAASPFGGLLKTMLAVQRAQFVYIFYPGTLSRVVARLCRWLAKPYALYLRGQQFSADRDAALFADAEFILAVSPGILPSGGALDGKVSVVRPMLEIGPADVVRRTHQPLDGRPLRVLFIGRLEPDKGVPELIEAIGLLRARGLSLELSLIGGGPLHAELLDRARAEPQLGLRIEGVIGDRQQIMRALEHTDVFVLPTHHEGFPRVLYEAMTKSAAVVTTMVGGIPVLMHDGENCLAVPVDNAVALADALESLARDHSLRQRLVTGAIDTVIEVLTKRPTHFTALRSGLEAHRAAAV
jgi:glycosyltransferase involved in cell wall biosynthesis